MHQERLAKHALLSGGVAEAMAEWRRDMEQIMEQVDTWLRGSAPRQRSATLLSFGRISSP